MLREPRRRQERQPRRQVPQGHREAQDPLRRRRLHHRRQEQGRLGRAVCLSLTWLLLFPAPGDYFLLWVCLLGFFTSLGMEEIHGDAVVFWWDLHFGDFLSSCGKVHGWGQHDSGIEGETHPPTPVWEIPHPWREDSILPWEACLVPGLDRGSGLRIATDGGRTNRMGCFARLTAVRSPGDSALSAPAAPRFAFFFPSFSFFFLGGFYGGHLLLMTYIAGRSRSFGSVGWEDGRTEELEEHCVGRLVGTGYTAGGCPGGW